MMKKAHLPVVRMSYIDHVIRSNHYPNCSQIAKKLDVNTKTIHRDIAYMRDHLDAPIEFDKKRNGFYYTETDYFLPVIHLKQTELLSFLVTEKILTQYQNTPYYEHVKKALEKLMHFIPEELPIQEMQQFYDFQTAPASVIEQEKYALIEKAVLDQVPIRIKYHSLHSNETNDRRVDPYYLLHKTGSWYFIGKCHLRNDIRIFALNRVLQVELTGDYFSIPKDFDKEKYLGDSFQLVREAQTWEVKLKFSPLQARWIRERQWHKTQQLTDLPDGSLLMEMCVTGLPEVKRWVLQYGAEVEVLAPEELREGVVCEIERMGKMYESELK